MILTGNAVLDKQHKDLEDTLEELHRNIIAGLVRKELSTTLDKLRNYATNHFRDEEQYMEEMHYPELAKHKELHKEFEVSLEKLVGEDTPYVKTFMFLREWLESHDRLMDRKYVEFEKRGHSCMKCSEDSTRGCHVVREGELHSEYYCDTCYNRKHCERK